MLEHLNGNRGRAVSARVLTVVFLLLALLPAGPAAAADDGSFLSPLAYWGLDDGAATVTEEDGAWSASLRVEKLDSRSALDEYAIFLVGTYPFTLSDTSFQEEEGSYAWSYRFSYTGSAAVGSLPGKEGCHLWLHASTHGTWDYTEIGWAWSDGLNPVSGDQSAQASPAREESAQGAGSASPRTSRPGRSIRKRTSSWNPAMPSRQAAGLRTCRPIHGLPCSPRGTGANTSCPSWAWAAT